MSYCYLSEILSYLIFNYWREKELHINTDCDVTVWVLCVISHIHNYFVEDYGGNHSKQVKNIKMYCFMGYLIMSCMLLKTFLGLV